MSESAAAFVVTHLQARHVRQGFDCGNPKLNTYLLHLASQHEKRHIGRTYVLAWEPDPKVMGFYTLASSSVSFQELPEGRTLPKYPVPTVKLGQLAVDISIKGRGWGKTLLLDALARAERISREIAIYAVELDAIDEAARAFYTHYQFTSLGDERNHMYCTMKQIGHLGLNSP